jgi:hypothetical protein
MVSAISEAISLAKLGVRVAIIHIIARFFGWSS